MNKMLIILVLAMVLVNCSARPQFGFGGCEYSLKLFTIIDLLYYEATKNAPGGGTGAGFGTGNAGLFGASASGVGLSSAYNGGFGSASGSGQGVSGGFIGGQYASGTGNGFSQGK
ncbi:hypothetical protein DAPPUDRAFT_264563 [Daphnia pulex]|uniref:Uncharacterized protein n=1 Tax=Daphnia pulex TaxID=6669 RepID=E9HRU9_DAPPU|nr:hypothetical protein DAPPUDRAFT_264563 [Daphnia pulex]|eukprot:EFX65533.1 hypothetical protein DAPPUDRAFT_264563 [Daphnia pulex]